MISVLIPAYNEEKAIGHVLEDVKKALATVKEKSEIIVVDDGSKDRTAQIVKSAGGVKLLSNATNRGYGSSLKKGLKACSGEWVLITDADGTYPAAAIPGLLGERDGYDMVVGARTGNNVKVPLARRPAKWFLGKLANYLAGQEIPDINSGLRVFRKDVAMRFFHLFPSGFSFTITITMACLTNDYNVKYVPIDYGKRLGESSMRKREFVRFSSLIVRMVMYFRPLKVFMPVSLVIFLAGLAFLVYEAFWKMNIAEVPVMLILAGLQIGFIGLLADLVVKKTSS